ncbi:contact-dependent growth inhibition system immunity protein [Micromonospora chaiyaphumensis]|nr:contact-dependent growth inhibition system immunity protein [Micromonospora chaiyaphumensis]
MTTIEQLERATWPDPGPDASALVRRCSALARTPLDEFTVEDLRLMLGQQIAVPALLPLALHVLLQDPLAEGDYYPGDLLVNVLGLPEPSWSGLPAERGQLVSVLTELVASSPPLDPGLKPRDPARLVRDTVLRFLSR